MLAGLVFVTGGWKAFKSCEYYSDTFNKWSNFTDMLQPRCYHGMVQLKGNLLSSQVILINISTNINHDFVI